MASFETTLATIPGENPKERLELVLCASGGLELRQQSWGEGVGWFTQGSIQIESSQLNDLRATLGQGGARQVTLPKAPSGWRPKVVYGDTA